MTCKNCLHYGICSLDVCFAYEDNGEIYQFQDSQKVEEDCVAFSDKSEWVRLPCKGGDTVWTLWGGIGSNVEVVRDRVWYVVIANGRILVTSEYMDLAEFGKEVFLTREEAEKALEERIKEA